MPKIDPNQIIDDAESIAKAAVAAPKPFFKSKTFRFNILLASTHYVGALPEKYAVPVAAAVNVALRLVTHQAIK